MLDAGTVDNLGLFFKPQTLKSKTLILNQGLLELFVRREELGIEEAFPLSKRHFVRLALVVTDTVLNSGP